MKRATRLAGLLALAAVACNGSGVEVEGPSGTLLGQITVGPFCPVEIEGVPCPPPPGTYESIEVRVFARSAGHDRLVAETRPDAGGRFEIELPSGSYRVALEHSFGIPPGTGRAQEARVDAGRVTSLSFDIDTGIR